jgi:hypothetical protein
VSQDKDANPCTSATNPNLAHSGVRDGLTRLERIVLYVLADTQRELNGRAEPTATLYGRVLDYVGLGEAELQACLQGLAQREQLPADDVARRVCVHGRYARID